ncbi:MAG: membrane protein YqaA with SNARE-associated domain [Glaciecola sp.]|jgi:membrane protein YqaA with SNARE-associated domain
MPYLILFLSSFLAATVIPFSSEAHLFYLITKNYNPYYLLIVASVGNTLGGISSYYLGYLCKWSWLKKYFGVKKDKVLNYQTKIDKYGVWIALLCWLPVVGDVIAVALGVFKLNWKKVLVLMFVGKAIRYSILLLL